MSQQIDLTGRDLIDFVEKEKAENCQVTIIDADGIAYYPSVRAIEKGRNEIIIIADN